MAPLSFPDAVAMVARAAHRIVNVQGRRLNIVIWVLAALSLLFLCLRIYCKAYRKRKFWWDDHFLVGSYLALFVSIVLQSVCVHYGLGLEDADIPFEHVFPMSKASYASGFCSIIALAWSKTSFSITLLRISSGWTKWAVWFTIVSINLVLGVNAALQWLRCWPIPRLWDWNLPGTCMDEKVIEVYNTFASVYSGSMDIFLALLPWKILWSVQINKKEKFGAVIAMSTGVFAGIVSFIKISTLHAISDPNTATNVNLFIFGTAEPAMTIIAASIPILRHLFRRDKSTIRGTTQGATNLSYVNNSIRLRSVSKGEHTVKERSADEESILRRSREWATIERREESKWGERRVDERMDKQ